MNSWKMDYRNTRHNPKFKKSSSKEGIVCFKLREARGTGWLSFNDMKMWKIPTDVYTRLLNLHHLYMSRCQISGELPVELGYLVNLEVLDFSFNKITNVPDNLLANLNQLKVLDMSVNKLRSFPYSVECLKSLKELSLAQNQLVAVPHTLSRLSNLCMLDLSHNMIQSLQGEMFKGEIQNCLCTLNLSDNLLDRLPRYIGYLNKLRELDISNNELYFLPTTARSLVRLQTLRFSGNKWTNPAPRYYDQQRNEDKLNSSYGSQAHNKLCTLLNPDVL